MMVAQKTDGTQILDTFLEQLYWPRTACGLVMKEQGALVLDIISKVFKYLQLKTFLIHIRTFR